MKIAINGAAGRMGKMLVSLAEGAGMEVIAKVDVLDGYDKSWPEGVEGVIDFSHHSAIKATMAEAVKRNIPCVIGTTGLTADEQSCVDEAAKVIPIVQSGNYSLGVNLLLEMAKKAAAVLGPEYDVEIVEMHHKHKKDAPSGTALMLAKSVAEGRNVAPDFIYGPSGHARRGGCGIGDHTVMFAGDVERVELVHKAQGREAFAAGALKALEWAKGKKAGIYTMRDVLGFV